MTQVLRLRILTSSRYEFPGEAEQVCLDRGIAAVGWPLDPPPTSWSDYSSRARPRYGDRDVNTVERLVRAKTGTAVWFRDRHGSYHLGELHGRWRYDKGQRAGRLDIANTRPCSWHEIGPASEVPGVVVRAFTGPGPAVRTIDNETVARYSRALLDGTNPADGRTLEEVLEVWLDDVDVEDLVALWLQHVEGVIVVPPDRKRGHPAYDLEFVSPSGRRGLVQVKSGRATYDFATLAAPDGWERWAYAASGSVVGEGRQITTEELRDFMRSARDWLPKKLTRWLPDEG